MFNVKRTKYVEGFDSLSGQKEDFSFEFWLEVKDDPLTVYLPGDHEGDLTGWVGTQAGQVCRAYQTHRALKSNLFRCDRCTPSTALSGGMCVGFLPRSEVFWLSFALLVVAS
jgi:hypothetical protein